MGNYRGITQLNAAQHVSRNSPKLGSSADGACLFICGRKTCRKLQESCSLIAMEPDLKGQTHITPVSERWMQMVTDKVFGYGDNPGASKGCFLGADEGEKGLGR